ncbi:MAG: cation-transporting P-type ATPase [Vicinamibacteria bacterium]|nr:cation-transporting P-type ATPase [Vicinamibacteria bacterium]
METLLARQWHHIPESEVYELLDTHPDRGLDRFEVERRQEHFGPNVLPQRKGTGPLTRFLQQFRQPLVYILLAAGLITLSLHEWVDAGVILGVVLVNAVIGFIQESKAAEAIEALGRTMTTEANLVRAGKVVRVPSRDLVPGDVVLLQSGDRVPADLRLFKVRNLQTDESALTGESLPVIKRAALLERDTSLAEHHNMAHSSTLVTAGQASGVVVATAGDTEIGRISELLSTAESLATPLTHKIEHFSKILLYVILALAAATFVVGVARGQSVVEMFMSAVALAVGAIPEGLPAAMTITLAIGINRMARRNAIIRKLPAVETLGSTTVICSDKTGTLTENQMTVRAIYAGGLRYEVSGSGFAPAGDVIRDGRKVAMETAGQTLKECLICGMLNNDSDIEESDGRWKVRGDPTEGALLAAGAKLGLNREQLNIQWPRRDTLPFESEHQYMATLHEGPESARLVYVKGAAEKLLPRCDRMLDEHGMEAPLDPDAVTAEVEALAREGLRVLVLARGKPPEGAASLEQENVASGLVLLGFQGMIDPPRQEAVAAVSACLGAGIKIKMITGDHALTAATIAEQVGITSREDACPPERQVITGRELESLSDEELTDRAARSCVFARVTPEQKLRLVRALQARGEVAAMTGDGVNDAPALRQANIGIAMGLSGTEVAKEAADMVLTDDNFATIEAAIEEGRGVFDNLTKFIVWTLPTNLGEGLVIMAAIFVGVALPILPVQILWINMTTAVLLGLTLAFEPKEPGIMIRPPREPDAPILTGMLIGRIVIVGACLLAGAFGLFEWALHSRVDAAVARTVAVNVFVFTELAYLFNCRSLRASMRQVGLFTNRWVWAGAGVMTLLQLLFTYSPLFNRVFGSAPIAAAHWLALGAVAIATSVIVSVEKKLWRRWGPGAVKP